MVIVFTAIVIAQGKLYEYDTVIVNPEERNHWANINYVLFKTLGYLSTVINCLSCAILCLVIRHAHKLT